MRSKRLNVFPILYENPKDLLWCHGHGRGALPSAGDYSVQITTGAFRDGSATLTLRTETHDLVRLEVGRYQGFYGEPQEAYTSAFAAICRCLSRNFLGRLEEIIGETFNIRLHASETRFSMRCEILAPERDTTAVAIICKEINGQLVFKCPACKEKHHHGYHSGHRESHCTRSGAFPDGYHIVEKGDLPPSGSVVFDGSDGLLHTCPQRDHLSDSAIADAKRRGGIGNPHHQHNDCIRIAYEWLDAQTKTRKHSSKCPPLKHIIEAWGGRYVSQSDVEVAAFMHPRIHGDYPRYNLSSRMIRPCNSRLAYISEAGRHPHYAERRSGISYASNESSAE